MTKCQCVATHGALPKARDMPLAVLDSLADLTPWHAFAPDGVTPSPAVSVAPVGVQALPGGPRPAARITAAGAPGVTLRRGLAPLDLTGFDALLLWVRSSRVADATAARPFFLEVRLASAAMALGDPANTWQRYVPVAQADTWQPVRLGLSGLPAAVRGAVATIQLRCADAGGFTLDFDGIAAVADAMLADTDAALRASLDAILSAGGAAVPAVLRPAATQAQPYFEIMQLDMAFSRERTGAAPSHGDFTDAGYTLWPPSNAYELLYQVSAFAADRATQAAMLDFVVRALPPRGTLLVNRMALPMEAVTVAPINQLGGHRTGQLPLFYRVSARQQAGPGAVVAPPRSVRLSTDMQAGGVQAA